METNSVTLSSPATIAILLANNVLAKVAFSEAVQLPKVLGQIELLLVRGRTANDLPELQFQEVEPGDFSKMMTCLRVKRRGRSYITQAEATTSELEPRLIQRFDTFQLRGAATAARQFGHTSLASELELELIQRGVFLAATASLPASPASPASRSSS